MSSDWYAKRLQGNTPPARGLTVGPAPVAPAPVQQQPVPQQLPHSQQEQESSQSLTEFLARGGSKGGQAAQIDGGRTCPNCGSGNVFSQAQQAMMTKDGSMASPNPKCFECGWNGRFTQADKASWA